MDPEDRVIHRSSVSSIVCTIIHAVTTLSRHGDAITSGIPKTNASLTSTGPSLVHFNMHQKRSTFFHLAFLGVHQNTLESRMAARTCGCMRWFMVAPHFFLRSALLALVKLLQFEIGAQHKLLSIQVEIGGGRDF